MADAITILSSSWNNNYYNTNSGVPTAVNTTINAAFLTGNVPSNGRNYSGGIENFIRYLETWTGYTNTYNGSMVCVFPSQIANQPWNGSGYYNPPSRNWTYDTNFLGGPASQPPNAPVTPVFSRGRWSILPLGSTNF